MAYRQPIAVRADVFRLANDYLVGGNKAAAQNLLYSRGLTWGDMIHWQQANVKLQRAPSEMSLPRGLRGMGAAAPAAPAEVSAATLAPPGSVILSPDLAIDWKGGNIYYQKMKLGIIASLLTGMVVKGVMFGGGKVSSAVRSRFGKKATA